MQEIIGSKALDHGARWLAIIHLKTASAGTGASSRAGVRTSPVLTLCLCW